MTTPAALAQARADQATADRLAAEQALLAIMQAISPRLLRWGAQMALASRELEARLEYPDCPRDLVRAHAAYRRAVNTERKATSAAFRARLEPAPARPAKPARRTRRPAKVGFVDYVRERLAEERVAA